MKRLFQWMMAAILICGTSLFTACSIQDNPVDDETGASGIAMIVKNRQIDYWHQIEKSFRDVCHEKGLRAYYFATSAENAYEEQLAAVEELRKIDSKKLKGIIFTPSHGANGESAEAEVAALAKERGIPVIILDSPVSATSPLASCPYFGTDNTAAGKAMAEKVTADKVAVFAMNNSPGVERAEAFKALKPDAVIYKVADTCNDEVEAVLDEFDDFVFFNGNCLVDAIPMLMADNKRVYTFDAYDEFLDELIASNGFFKGVMAQNTFGMARKAVEAILTNAQQGEMVPTFYITEDNLGDENVKPFLDFYGKQAPAIIEGLEEKLIGKWMDTETEGEPTLTSDMSVVTFVSPTKAIYSTSKTNFSETKLKWSSHREYDAKISGNKVTLIGHPENNPAITLQEEYIITAITATEIVCKSRHTTFHEGQTQGRITEKNVKMKKIDVDYSTDIIGLWENKGLIGEETYNDGNDRLEFKADGTYIFYHKNESGEWETVTTREFQISFVDGTLVATRWKDQDDAEHRESWEIVSLKDDKMQWKGLREKEDGTTFEQIMNWERIESE